VNVLANAFRLNFKKNTPVYQYPLTVTPDEIFEACQVHDILAQKHRHMSKILGAYFPSGQMIFTMNPIAETVIVETSYKG